MVKRALTTCLLLAFVATPTAVMAQQRHIPNNLLTTNAQDPLSISNVVLGADVSRQSLRVCFSFINLTSKNVASARFHFALLDQFNQQLLSGNLTRNADSGSSFAPGQTVEPPDTTAAGYSDTNNGSQSCWLIPVTNPAALQSANGQQISGLSINVLALSFADGSVWTPGQTFTRAFNRNGAAFVFTPEQFNTTWSTEPDTAPVAVTDASLESHSTSDNKGEMEQCVSFRNVTNKAASSITFSYVFNDGSGTPLPTSLNWHSTFKGKFTPPILIEDKCWTAALPAVATIRRMRHEIVRVRNVTFADGSQWAAGSQWVKGFNNDGTAFTGAQTLMAGVPSPGVGTSPGMTPASPSDALAGTVGPTGQEFGEIAWVKGSGSAIGVSVDKPTVFDAQFDAMASCKAHAAGAAGSCQLLLNGLALNSPETRCVVLLFDGKVFAVGRGGSQDAADIDGIARLTSSHGSVDAARALVKACNSQ